MCCSFDVVLIWCVSYSRLVLPAGYPLAGSDLCEWSYDDYTDKGVEMLPGLFAVKHQVEADNDDITMCVE